MKVRVVFALSVCAVVVAMASFVPSRAQEASVPTKETPTNGDQAATKNWAAGNPLKIALLKWYQANQTTSFSVGRTKNSDPYGLAFDGQNIWTANSEGTVTKLRASDGAILGNFAVGGRPMEWCSMEPTSG